MNICSLIKTLNQNKKLTRNAIIHYLSLLYLASVNPCALDAYLATEVTEKELEKRDLLAGNLSKLNELLTEQGLLRRLEGKSQGTYILGEKHLVDTLAGKILAEAWYFEQPEIEMVEHGEKIKASKAKTYNEEINEVIDFYYQLYTKKYEIKPAIDYPKTRGALKNTLKQFPFQVVKACIPVYLDLEDEYLENKRYPLLWLMSRMVDCQITLQEKIAHYGMQNQLDEFYNRWISKVIEDKKLTEHEAYLIKHNGGLIAKQNRGNNPKPEGGGEHIIQKTTR